MTHYRKLCLAGGLPFLCSLSFAASIWTEGESASPASVQRHPFWYDKVKKDLLSGGDWLSNFGPKEGIGEYKISVPEDGSYTLWIRANPLQAKLSYAIGGGDWVAVDFKENRGQQNIAEDNKPDLRFISWVKAGTVELKKGEIPVKFRMETG